MPLRCNGVKVQDTDSGPVNIRIHATRLSKSTENCKYSSLLQYYYLGIIGPIKYVGYVLGYALSTQQPIRLDNRPVIGGGISRLLFLIACKMYLSTNGGGGGNVLF